MFNFNQFKLRERILLGYGVPLLLTVAATSVVIVNAKKVEQQTQANEAGWNFVRDSERLEILLYKRQASIRSYLLTLEESFLQQYTQDVQDYRELIQSLQQRMQEAGSDQQQRLSDIRQLGEEAFTINQELIDLIQSGKTNQAILHFKQGDVLPVVEHLTAVLHDFNTTEERLQKIREQDGQAATRSLIWAAFVGTLSAIVIALMLGYWIASRIAQQINAIASNITSSSAEIAATIEQQERTVVQQSSSVNETSTTIDQLSASAQLSANQAGTSANGAQQALTLAEEGTQAVTHTLQGMTLLKQKVEAIAEQILHLSEQTNQIGSITGLVRDLANQTNMLALNAAVEAVRAGENGKGFSVVANEIRKLADQSKQSAERINTLVSDIQTSINATVMVTDEGTKTVEEGTQIAQATAAAFDGVTHAVHEVFQNSQQIALTAKQQAIAINQIVTAMNMLTVSAHDTASGISQTKISTQQLHEAAQTLKAVV